MLVVAHEGINRLVLSWAAGAGLHAMGGFEQDTGCVNVLDFDMKGNEIERPIIKAVNLTPYNYLKHGMNLTSLEAIFERDVADVLV
jgi:probable phosphoglycerate mutase